MAKLKVKYTVTHTEYVIWPDDEIDSLTYDNLLQNINHEDARNHEDHEILEVVKDGKNFDF